MNDDWKNFEPRKNPVKPVQQETYSLPIDAIDTMELPELRLLVRRMACQCGLVATMTLEETAQAMLDVLAETALKPIAAGLNMKADINNRLNAIDKWLDRTRGKPAQSPEVVINTAPITTNIIGCDDAETIKILEASLARRKRMITIDN